MSQQPGPITNDNGGILTVGIQVGNDRTTIVMPFVLDGGTFDPVLSLRDLIDSFASVALPLLLDCLSIEVFVTFLATEGMIDDRIPYRVDFTPDIWPGTVTGSPLSSQVAALCVFYEDPADGVPGQRIRLAKNFVPGVSGDQVDGDLLHTVLIANLQAFAAPMLAGIASLGQPSAKWYRCLAVEVPRTPNTNVRRIITADARGYVVTQKRRLIPR